MYLARLLLLCLPFVAAARADTEIELLKSGESLTYRVGWGLLGHVGDMTISGREETIDGRPHLRISTTSATRGFVRMLYSFNGDASTLFETGDGRLLSATAKTRSSKKPTHASIAFDYARREAAYVDHLNPNRSRTQPIPPGHPVDLMTALIQTRAWSLSPGQSREALVLFDDEFYSLQITAEREETISTPDGPRQTLLLIPRMIGKPKGMFRRGGEIRVWVSADEQRLPLRFEVKLKVGTAYAVLSDYRPPEKN